MEINDQDKRELRKHTFREPIGINSRAYLIRYIKLLTNEAKELTKKQLYGADGHGIAMDITSVWVVHGADDEQDDGWITPENEPILNQLLETAADLDGDANNPQAWDKLFKLVSKLN